MALFASSARAEFDEWWSRFPRKVGKIAAEQAYYKARKRASASDLLVGVARYVQHKPAWQEWAHPKTWLTQGRWDDDYDTPAPVTPPEVKKPAAYRMYIPLAERDKQREAGN